MKKIYMILAVLALLTLSLNAQIKDGKVAQHATPTVKVNTALEGIKKAASMPAINRAPSRADRATTLNLFIDTTTYVSEYLPIYGYYHDDAQHNQLIYPASMLTDMVGKKITSMTFYPASYSSSSGINFYNGSITFKLTEVNGSTGFDSNSPSLITGSMTTVKTVNMPSSANTSATTWVIAFDDEYEYNGGDLVIDLTTTTGGYGHTYFYIGTTTSLGVAYPGLLQYGSYGPYAVGYVPAVTFTYEEGQQPTTPTLTSPVDGSTVDVGINNGSGVSQAINIKGKNLTQDLTVSVSGTGFSVSRDVTVTAAEANAGKDIIVTYNGNAENATGTLTVSSNEVSATVNLTASYSDDVTVCDGGYFIEYLPVWGYWHDAAQHNQMIYPASMLTNMVDKNITSMTFYPTGGYVDSNDNGQYDSGETTYQGLNFYGGSVTFSLMNLSSGTSPYTDDNATLITGTMTEVKTLVPQNNASATTWLIEFDEDFTYTGGDLLIDMTSTAGTYGRTAFSCDVLNTNQSALTLTTSSGDIDAGLPILPKVTFSVEAPALNPTIEISPATQTISDAAAATLTVTGTDIESNINVGVADNTNWSLNPTSLSNTGGNVSVSYTGRDLSASTTVTASATGATDATATVDYVADVYIVGNFGNGWDFNNGTQMTYNNGTYTTTITVDAGNYILFARLLGNSNPWNTRDVFGPDSGGDWWMQGDNASGTIDVNDDDPIYFTESGTYTITINSDGTFTITKQNEGQTATPTITYTVSDEYVTITATGDGTVTLNVPGYDPVSGEGEASITIPRGFASNTITVTATAQEDGKTESAPASEQITIPAGSGWTEMDGTYSANDLLSFTVGGEDIMLVDQFMASTLNNGQPDHYTYTLRQTVNGETNTSTPVEIPVYKTNSSIQGLYTQNQVDGDTDMKLKAGVLNTEMDYDVNPDHNVLYYSLYRSGLNETYPAIDVDSRISQLQKFEDNASGTVQYFMYENHTSGVTPKYDHLGNEIAERLDTNWVEGAYNDQLAYVPVIWTFGLYSGREDGKNNSYGSDIKREYLGKVEATISGEYTAGNAYGTWEVGNTEYCVFHPTINVTGYLPQEGVTIHYNDGDEATYVPYKCRAWCTTEGIHDFVKDSEGHLTDNGTLDVPYLLGEAEFGNDLTATIGGDWTGLDNDPHSTDVRDQWSFGLPSTTNPASITYVIRFYYKKDVTEGNAGTGSKLRDGDSQEYFIVQTSGTIDEWVVGLNELNNYSVVESVTYVNPQGMQSSRPFDGVNIVVTRYSDGTTRTSKIIR